MLAGDEKYLLPRDRGPVKAYVRDVVDARRNLLGLFMPLAVLVLASLFTPSAVVQRYASLLCMVMLLGMFAEGLVLAWLVITKVRRKFPDATEKTYSLGWYAFTRASQLRRLRVPRPRVRYGQAD
jgi:threonine/homoserine/homoserine lactone efflux protein